MNEGSFFQDLAVLMSAAGLVAVIFARFGWPKVIGYILAGIVMSEHTWGGSFLVDESSVRTIGQLGVVFLMFAMGVSFSTREMRRIRSVAIPCAVVDTVVMIWLGYVLGVRVFGWSSVQSLFLGVAICDSATTLLAKVIDEMRWSNRPFAKCVLGTSVCEDIICVGAIAVATGFAEGQGALASALAKSLGGLALFFLAVLVFGLILVPRLLVSVAKRRDDESLVLAILGCCFFVSFVAYRYDFSLAIGAFLMGFIVSNSDVKPRAEALVEPLKSMFSAVFFVSIGLLVNPRACLDNIGAILLVSAVIIVGKSLNNFVASMFSGQDVKTSVQNGMGLAQIGEFAFMVAILYLGVADRNSDDPMFQIAVGASLLTTLLNPTMIRLSDPLGDFVQRHFPRRLARLKGSYDGWLAKLRSAHGAPAVGVLRKSAILLGVYAALVLVVAGLCSMLSQLDYSRFSLFFERHDAILFFFLANLFAVGMLPLIVSSARTFGGAVCDLLIGGADLRWTAPVRQFVQLVMVIVAVTLYFAECTMLNVSFAPSNPWVLGVISGVLVLIGFLGWRFFTRAGQRATLRLNEALASEDRRERLDRMMSIPVPSGSIHSFTLGMGSPAVGSTVVTLNVRAKTGAVILSVRRGEEVFRNVGPDLEFRVGDELTALGDGSQMAALKDMLGVTS